jgi:asparagine synthase (glutamine-hydrolysing)
MCGISGVARIDGTHLGDGAGALLTELVRVLSHRGPDDERTLQDGPVGLAFTRLSLVDPADGGQPFVSDDGSLVLIANGEIYNHRELEATLPAGTRMRTGSDCEVLMHLYRRDGLRFLDQVNGMFAVVLWDKARDRILLCRDRFGIKPLYYHRDRERLLFASEIKALFSDPATPRRLDWIRSLADYGLNSTPSFTHDPVVTWFEDIDLVPAATIMCIGLRDGSTTTHQYWSLPGADDASDASDEEYVTEYRELLAASVRDCATADTELGLFLSGGIDSAAVAALSGYEGLPTFSALTAATLLNRDAEGSHRTARGLGLPHHQVLFPAERIPDVAEWKRLLWLLESPLCGPEQFYKYELHRFAKQTYPELRGMLLGAASDEFNGGYSPGYAVGGDWQDFTRNISALARRQSLDGRPQLGQWWDTPDAPLLRDEVAHAAAGRRIDDPYAEFLRWKHRSIQQYNVWHEDRTAAGNGIEARVPFLDHRLVELSASIPRRWREALLWNKNILRRAMVGILPQEVLDRPKMPFYIGEGASHTYRVFVRMLEQDNGALVEEALSSERAREFVDTAAVRNELARLAKQPDTAGVESLLRIVNLGLLERMTADLPAPPIEWSAGPKLLELPVYDEWETHAQDIADRVLDSTGITPDGRYRLSEDVLLTHTPADPGTWYVLVSGTCEFVLDDREEPVGAALLLALGGDRPLSDVLFDAGCTLAEATSFLEQALEAGLVEAVPSPPAAARVPSGAAAAAHS